MQRLRFGQRYNWDNRHRHSALSAVGLKGADEPPEVILFGLSGLGVAIAERLLDNDVRIMLIDNDPAAVRDWQSRGVDAVYGDVTDPEYLVGLPLTNAGWVVSTLRHYGPYLNASDPRQTLLKVLNLENFQGRSAVAIYDHDEEAAAKEGGADLVIDPFGHTAKDLVEQFLENRKSGD